MTPSAQVPIVKVIFHAMQNLIFSPEEYAAIGKFKGVLKEFRVSIRDVQRVEVTTMSAIDFAQLPEWEG